MICEPSKNGGYMKHLIAIVGLIMEFFFHKGRFSAAWAAKNQVEIIFRCARSS